MEKFVLSDVIDHICFITLNRPETFNAIDVETAKQLAHTLSLCFDPKIRAVVIRGAGKAFCSGGDLAFLRQQEDLSSTLGDIINAINRYIADIRLLPKPVIAAVNGVAAGSGFSLALACDLRIVSKKAKFKQAYTGGGLVPDGGWSILAPALLGLSKTNELLFLDPVIDAETAHHLGIANMVVEEEELEQTVKTVAQQLAGGATIAFGEAKALVNRILLPGLETHLEQERQAMIRVGKTTDAQEGLAAFLSKGKPAFQGR